MPRRPRAHELEELSRIQLRSIFSTCGWVVWDFHPDYGEDLFVRVFSHEMATPYSFFVQAKATDHIEDYIQKDGKHLTYPIRTDHLEHWDRFWEPVVLTVWDARTNTTYWQIIQDFLRQEGIKKLPHKSLNVRIPLSNVLDQDGLEKIFQRTRTRYERFNILAEGMSELVTMLEEHFGVQVKYGSELPTWTVKYSSDEYKVILLGDLYQALLSDANQKNMEVDSYFHEILKDSLILDAYFEGKAYEQRTEHGGVIIRLNSPINEHVKGAMDISDSSKKSIDAGLYINKIIKDSFFIDQYLAPAIRTREERTLHGAIVIRLKNADSEFFKLSFDTYEEWEQRKQAWTERSQQTGG